MLTNIIRDKIKNSPDYSITFAEYMEDSLYHPQYGYYMKHKHKIGKQGDFYTSSSIHSVFAETLVDVAIDIWQKNRLSCYSFVEMGAGTGAFAKQFLDDLELRFPETYHQLTYYILEKSSFHQQLQQDALTRHKKHICWIEDIGNHNLHMPILFSNELVDAFPVHLIQKRKSLVEEVMVTWSDKENSFREKYVPLVNMKIKEYLDISGLHLQEGYRMEIPIQALDWAKQIGAVEEAIWITIDYGYTNEQLMQSHYRDGTLLCYYKHQVDENPLEKPGEKDITYHIHFDQIKALAEKKGWKCLEFYSQAEFLLQAGILNKLEDQAGGDPFHHPALKKNRAIRQFIMPDGISSYFKVLILAKGAFQKQEYKFMRGL